MAQFLELRHLCQGKMQGIDGATPIQNKSVAPCMSLKMTYLLQSSELVCTHDFSSTSSCLFGT
jgi:hypothetical protein